MAVLNAVLVTFTVTPLKRKCPPKGGVFKVVATVTTVAPAGGGTVDVSMYGFRAWRRDVLLDSTVITVGAGRVKTLVNFSLFCDAQCTIAGARNSSGKNPCDVYAYAEDVAVGGPSSKSGMRTLECVEAEDDDSGEDGGGDKKKTKSAVRQRS